jgi:hypothetical protein
MLYWINDEESTPQRFPLRKLLRRVWEVGKGGSICEVYRVNGHGPRVFELAQQCEEREWVPISFEEADSLCGGQEQWFYDFEARVPGSEIRFGLHDSTALFVSAPLHQARAIVESFSKVKAASDSE